MKTQIEISETQSENWQFLNWQKFNAKGERKAIETITALFADYFKNNVNHMEAEKFKRHYSAFISWHEWQLIVILQDFTTVCFYDGWTNLIPSLRLMDDLNGEKPVHDIVNALLTASKPIHDWFGKALDERCKELQGIADWQMRGGELMDSLEMHP